jgi:hypothetical protein
MKVFIRQICRFIFLIIIDISANLLKMSAGSTEFLELQPLYTWYCRSS